MAAVQTPAYVVGERIVRRAYRQHRIRATAAALLMAVAVTVYVAALLAIIALCITKTVGA